MKICYFGFYNPQYIRDRVILEGLRRNGIEIIECREEAPGFRGLLNLFLKYRKLSSYDLMIVGSSDRSRSALILAKFLTKKKILWDAFYSLYDTMVNDRKLARPFGLKALYYWTLDWLGCLLADKILLDTNEHIKYFSQTFRTNEEKFIRIFVGADDRLFFPRNEKRNDKDFLVHFHGKYIPLQGIQHILKAAKILEKEKDIRFRLVGKGQTYDSMRRLGRELGLTNVEFVDRVPYEKIPDLIAEADVSLGIFGDTEKAARVIPNKIYEAMAMGKPIITADTPGIRELFTDRKNVLLCKVADPEDLAGKILELKNDKELRIMIGEEVFKLFAEAGKPEIVIKELLPFLKI